MKVVTKVHANNWILSRFREMYFAYKVRVKINRRFIKELMTSFAHFNEIFY